MLYINNGILLRENYNFFHKKEKPNYALVLAWNFFEEIKKKNSSLAHKFISIKDLEA